MAASPAQIAANRVNALQSTGPKTAEGKDASRRNALKHGLTGRGVVIPGEDEHEVALRVAALEDQLVPEGDILAALLVRQVAIASIRVERAYRHETALAAERMRRAADVYDDGRKALAEEILGEIGLDPATARRRLMAAPEGVDALLGRLRALREKAEPRSFVAWDDAEGVELDLCLGCKPAQVPASRVGMLTRGIVYDLWEGLDPAEHAHLDFEARLHWAAGEIHALITAEITHLEAHRASLDPERFEKGRAEAAERSLLDLGADGTALRRYAGASERSMLKLLKELREIRREAESKAADPAKLKEALMAPATATKLLVKQELGAELASFCPSPTRHRRPEPGAPKVSVLADGTSSYVPISVGLAPPSPAPQAP